MGDCNPKCVVKAGQVEVSVRRKMGAVQSRAEEEVKGRGPSPPWGWVFQATGVREPLLHASRSTFLT